LNNRNLKIGVVVITIVAVIAGYYFLANQPIIVRLVTKNPPVEDGLILPQNEKRSWDPASIKLTVDVPVILVVVNNDDIESHQFSIPELNVETEPISPFESATIEFTPTKTGTFVFLDPRLEETYTYVDYRGETVNQIVDHSIELGELIVTP
jgi:heme/copper-type cytochrome/quinol oxidase subunit 2|tara:strand:- start:394 stop:849 length:456 start_codon:yes stop_codon:yes gene_type:complete